MTKFAVDATIESHTRDEEVGKEVIMSSKKHKDNRSHHEKLVRPHEPLKGYTELHPHHYRNWVAKERAAGRDLTLSGMTAAGTPSKK